MYETEPNIIELNIINKDDDSVLFSEISKMREFKTGSKGYFVGGKMTNKKTGEKYQISCNIILIGSKEK